MGRFRRGWLMALAAMTAAMAALTVLLVALSLLLPSPGAGYLYSLSMWAIIPLAGAAAAFFATRHGLISYAAWAVPPICQTAAHWLLLGYPPPSAGMPLVAAGLALVAAAAAEVLNERMSKAKKGGGK